MRASLVIAAGAAVALGIVVEYLPAPRDPSPPREAFAAMPSTPAPPAPVPSAAAAKTVIADAAPPAPAPQAVPDLPTMRVDPLPEHTVPDYVPPAAPVVLPDHDRPDPLANPRMAAQRVPPAIAPRPMPTVTGTAALGGALSLRIRGRTLPLFGVRLPAAGDRCVMSGSRTPRPCGEVARAALAARLRANDHVSCRVPPGQRGHRDAAICLDGAGIDLAGYLIGSGLALADRSASYDYVGAEGVARSLHRGLWLYR